MSAFPLLSGDVARRFDVSGPRYTSYPTAPEWTSTFGADAHGRMLADAARQSTLPLSLYVHLPFCRERCTFCGCNVVIAKDRRRADVYIDHVAEEMKLVADRLGDRRRLSQIHWGGGTPTFLDEIQLRTLWDEMRAQFTVLDDAEIAIEIHPSVTTASQLDLLRSLGFNRLSMGVQDFDPRVQEAIGRHQGRDETERLLEHARTLGFLGVNFDLVYGLPFQTLSSWTSTLSEVIRMRPDRVAVYSFAYVPTVRPHQRRLPIAQMPAGSEKLALFGQAYDAFVGAGYHPIGMDHFALPEDELSRAQARRALGRNFQGYTVRSATDVVAFGITSISDLTSAYAQNVASLEKYYTAVSHGVLATGRGIILTEEDRMRRSIIDALMCNFCVDLDNFGDDATSRFDQELEEGRDLEHEGLLHLEGTSIELTPLGRVFVRSVAMIFDAYLRRPGAVRSFSRTI